jgi:hypothetical protein
MGNAEHTSFYDSIRTTGTAQPTRFVRHFFQPWLNGRLASLAVLGLGRSYTS